MNINILLCDDEVSFTDRLYQWLVQHPVKGYPFQITVINDSSQLDDKLLSSFDLCFLDIDMTPQNGFVIARRLRKLQSKALILFITNYAEFSPEGYEVSAFRFLLKNKLDEKLPCYLDAAIMELQKRQNVLFFSFNGIPYQIPLQEILYLESKQRTIWVHFTDIKRKPVYFYGVMERMQEALSSSGFLRIHQSFLVNMEYIRHLQHDKVLLQDDTVLPVSSRKYATIRIIYLNWLNIHNRRR